MKRSLAVLLAVLVVACSGETKTAAPPVTASEPDAPAIVGAALRNLTSPAGKGSGEPFLSSTKDGILMSWLEPVEGTDRTALRFARLRGERWSAARTIVERNDLFVNWADFPSIVEDAKGVLFAQWLQKSGGDTYSYDVRMSTSTDGGMSWSEPFLLNRDGRKAEHGFATLVPLAEGGVAAAWLDGRNMKGGDHDHGDAGEMTLRYATVSAKGEIAEETELDSRTCECCATGMAISAIGPVVVYRDRSPDETRDIAYVVKKDGSWTKPAAVSADGWKIAGCPVNGPQIDAIGDRAVTAWFTSGGEKARAYVAFSSDGGATFGRPVQIDDGKPVGRLDVVLLDRETALVSWLEQTAAGAEIRARRVTSDGAKEYAFKVADSSTARAAGFTRIAGDSGGVYFAWTGNGEDGKGVQLARRTF